VRILIAAIAGVYGLVIGSFLNVVIWRVPRQESLVKPGSHCPGCDAPIAPRDNIPVLSWLLLRGRCRNCGEPISNRYPFVELLTGVLFAAVGARFFDSWALPAFLLLTAALIAISAIAIKMAMISTTTINSMRVKPSSLSRLRETNERSASTGCPLSGELWTDAECFSRPCAYRHTPKSA
jgi:prepilin signal peptidase PulO-like enzyme (type II secretory pathway)